MRLHTIYTLCKENIDKLENCEITTKHENAKYVTVVRKWTNAKDHILLRYVSPGLYQADFSGKRFRKTRP